MFRHDYDLAVNHLNSKDLSDIIRDLLDENMYVTLKNTFYDCWCDPCPTMLLRTTLLTPELQDLLLAQVGEYVKVLKATDLDQQAILSNELVPSSQMSLLKQLLCQLRQPILFPKASTPATPNRNPDWCWCHQKSSNLVLFLETHNITSDLRGPCWWFSSSFKIAFTSSTVTPESNWPHHSTSSMNDDKKKIFVTFTLRAANSSSITTYGTNSMEFKLGLRQSFRWNFIIIDIQSATVGVNFLTHYGLLTTLSLN